jgi:RNA polymerase sigma-70 factor (ECF subfamily)
MQATAPVTTALADDADLLARLRAGQAEAFEALVRRHGGRLLAVVRRVVVNEEDAHDVLQDTFLCAFRALNDFDGRSQLGSWLHRIAVNCALQKLRTCRRKPLRSIDELLPTFLDDGHRSQPEGPWPETGESALVREETRAAVKRAIDELPDDFRAVLVLRDIEGLDTAEAAHSLGVSAAVVKTRLHRARQALRTLLDPHVRGGKL